MMREWLETAGDFATNVQDQAQFRDDCIGPEYFFTIKNQLQLESKKDLTARGLASPDYADSLAMAVWVSRTIAPSSVRRVAAGKVKQRVPR